MNKSCEAFSLYALGSLEPSDDGGIAVAEDRRNEEIDQSALGNVLYTALDGLDPVLSKVLIGLAIGMDDKDIATENGVSVSSVSALVNKARRQMCRPSKGVTSIVRKNRLVDFNRIDEFIEHGIVAGNNREFIDVLPSCPK